jgi:hypothetical protein
MKIRIVSSASLDLAAGYHFYEQQSEGLGDYFLDSLYSDIDSLMVSAGVHAVHFGKYHRLLSKRFPFAVYYKIEGSMIKVYAVLDSRRSPTWTRKKLIQ